MAGVAQQAAQGLTPGADILRRDLGHRHHLLVEGGLVLRDGVDRAAGTAPPSWPRGCRRRWLPSPARRAAWPPPRCASALRPTATAPAARACAPAAASMSSTGSSMRDVGPGARARRDPAALVPQVGTAAKAVSGKGVRQRQEDRDALHRARIHHGDELVVGDCRGPAIRRGSSSEIGTCTASMPA